MMVDLFPFPNITEKDPEKQIAELVNYLIQFKETLEFSLANISTENLSASLIDKLNAISSDIDKSNDDRENEVAQITKNALTISDVCNSDIFKLAVRIELQKGIIFNVNFDTGELEYSVSYEEEVI